MALFGGVDEIVIRTIHPFHHRLEARHIAIEQLARRQPLLDGRLLDLLSVLVGPGQKIHIVAIEPHEACNGVGGDRFIGVADMWRAIGV